MGRTKKAAQNSGSQRTMPKGRRFQPGQSGNPGGRPKLSHDAKEWLRLHSGELTVLALEATHRLLDSKNEHVAARVANDWLNKVLPDHAWLQQELEWVLERLKRALPGEEYERVVRAILAMDGHEPELQTPALQEPKLINTENTDG